MRLFIYYYYYIFLAWLLNKKDGCDDLPGSVTPQASMKLSPPHRSPALPRRGCWRSISKILTANVLSDFILLGIYCYNFH